MLFSRLSTSIRRMLNRNASRRRESNGGQSGAFVTENLEVRRLLTVIAVRNNEFTFTDSQGTEQTIGVSGGWATVTLSDLEGDRHEIERIQLGGRQPELAVSTDVGELVGRRLSGATINEDVDRIRLQRLTGELAVTGNVGRAQVRRINGGLTIDGNLQNGILGRVVGDVFVGGDLQNLRSNTITGALYVEGDIDGRGGAAGCAVLLTPGHAVQRLRRNFRTGSLS